jgi:hypothetical protein
MMFTPSATGFTASTFDVEGKLSGFITACFGFDGLGKDFADGVKYACVGDGIRSRLSPCQFTLIRKCQLRVSEFTVAI